MFSKRSWGWYFVLLNRKHFKLKLLYFRKGKQCSLQFHRFRSELWLFLYGVGLFSLWSHINTDKKEMHGTLKYPGDFAVVNPEKLHQFTASKNTLVLEIQYGTRCDELDIQRII